MRASKDFERKFFFPWLSIKRSRVAGREARAAELVLQGDSLEITQVRRRVASELLVMPIKTTGGHSIIAARRPVKAL